MPSVEEVFSNNFLSVRILIKIQYLQGNFIPSPRRVQLCRLYRKSTWNERVCYVLGVVGFYNKNTSTTLVALQVYRVEKYNNLCN
mgnify:CR=1 FL=1